jgi:hypothetical protein
MISMLSLSSVGSSSRFGRCAGLLDFGISQHRPLADA